VPSLHTQPGIDKFSKDVSISQGTVELRRLSMPLYASSTHRCVLPVIQDRRHDL